MTKLEELAEKYCISRCKIGGELHDVTFTLDQLRALKNKEAV